jgi:hypothetical protein
MNELESTLRKLKETKHLELDEIRDLSIGQRDDLFDEIKRWCVYSNGNVEKLELR